ncbi:MAG: protein kinase [Streptosporangiaceae bacterium]
MARTRLRENDPARIGRYRLTARLGSGGMGVVYLGVAEDGSLVAVKVLRPELADDPDFRRRFGAEVSSLTRIRGDCTVRVLEADTDSPRPFMVTEYADGPTLAEYVKEHGPLSADMLYGLATGLAEALTVIHAARIVHRDLKPPNVIMTRSGPKVIDFGIAQKLDGTVLTKAGVWVGSAGYMAPEQVEGRGRPGPAADIFVWGATIGYAATGEDPFGSGPTGAVLYRVVNCEPDIAGLPESLEPLVKAAMAKEPQYRPAAHELLDRLTNLSALPSTNIQPGGIGDSPTETVLSLTWLKGPLPSQSAATHLSQPPVTRISQPVAKGSVLLQPAPPGAGPSGPRPPSARRGPASRRTATMGGAALVVVAAAILSIALLTPHHAKVGSPAANQNVPATATLPTYPGQLQRGVFQTIDRIVDSGNTMVTTGSQTSDGLVRQQFFASSDGGTNWHLAPVHTPDGGQPPLGDVATRIAGGPGGWMAEGPQAIWTSQNGLSWTLAAAHGITPQLPGDQVLVLTSTANGFVAAGQGNASGGGNEAVIWVSHDGINWQRSTATQLGLTASGPTPQTIQYATSRGNDTVISDGGSLWLSTDGGSAWTPVTVPVDHGAQNQISGLSYDGSGLIAVRPGETASGSPDGVAYFSPNGQAWQFSGIIDQAGGWRPGVVKGGSDGFVVTGTVISQNVYVAYTSTGTGTTWLPTGSLGDTSSGPTPIAAVGSHGTVVAAGPTNGSRISQQPVFLKANAAGNVRSVSLSSIPGGLIPEVAVNSTAVAGGEQIAVGSANGYPAVWRRASNGSSWALVSQLSVVSGPPGLAALSSVSHGSAAWIAAGTPGPVILTSTDGINWQPADGSIQQDLAGVAAVATASGPAGYVIAGKLVESDGAGLPDVFWSPNLTSWTKAHDVNDNTGSSQVLAVAAGPKGFVSVGSHNDQPALWVTTNGRAWTTVELPLSAGATGVLQHVAVNGNHVVALGQQTTAAGTVPLAELSTDGGTNWQQVRFISAGPDTAVTALTARTGGFTAAGQFGAAGKRDAAVWTSANGTSWTQTPVSSLIGGGSHDITTLVPSGSAVIAIDSIQTQEGQKYITVPLPAR